MARAALTSAAGFPSGRRTPDAGGLGANLPPGAEGVPNYDIYGHQHYRAPYKDKSEYVKKGVERDPRWRDAPGMIKSRSELQQSRARARVPGPSYDFDGDGVVGQLDYFIGRSFDKDADGRLTPGERRKAEKALDAGWLDRYERGFDSQGDNARPYALQQRRGVILTADNVADVSKESYHQHHNAHYVPKHETKTALALSRTAEAKGHGFDMGDKMAARKAKVVEASPPNARTHPRTCAISHIRQAAEADHQLARVRGGLVPVPTALNPERENKTLGLSYVEEPYFATRGQLVDTRRECMRQECDDLRVKGEELMMPHSVRASAKQSMNYEFRRPQADGMTLTRLKDRRKIEKIEYDMERFGVKPREYPRFSADSDTPFWLRGEHGGPGHSTVPITMARAVSEPALKVTDVPFGEDLQRASDLRRPRSNAAGFCSMPQAGMPLPGAGVMQAPETHHEHLNSLATQDTGFGHGLGARTVKRWTSEMIERGQGRNKPRYFDCLPVLNCTPQDFEPLDVTSSMEPVRSNALRDMAKARKANAENPIRSRLFIEDDSGSGGSQLPSACGLGGPSSNRACSIDGSSAVTAGSATATRSRLGEQRTGTSSGAERNGANAPVRVTAPPTIRLSGDAPALAPRSFAAISGGGSALAKSHSASSTIGVRSGGFQCFDKTRTQSNTLTPCPPAPAV